MSHHLQVDKGMGQNCRHPSSRAPARASAAPSCLHCHHVDFSQASAPLNCTGTKCYGSPRPLSWPPRHRGVNARVGLKLRAREQMKESFYTEVLMQEILQKSPRGIQPPTFIHLKSFPPCINSSNFCKSSPSPVFLWLAKHDFLSSSRMTLLILQLASGFCLPVSLKINSGVTKCL